MALSEYIYIYFFIIGWCLWVNLLEPNCSRGETGFQCNSAYSNFLILLCAFVLSVKIKCSLLLTVFQLIHRKEALLHQMCKLKALLWNYIGLHSHAWFLLTLLTTIACYLVRRESCYKCSLDHAHNVIASLFNENRGKYELIWRGFRCSVA